MLTGYVWIRPLDPLPGLEGTLVRTIVWTMMPTFGIKDSSNYFTPWLLNSRSVRRNFCLATSCIAFRILPPPLQIAGKRSNAFTRAKSVCCFMSKLRTCHCSASGRPEMMCLRHMLLLGTLIHMLFLGSLSYGLFLGTLRHMCCFVVSANQTDGALCQFCFIYNLYQVTIITCLDTHYLSNNENNPPQFPYYEGCWHIAIFTHRF